MMSNINKKYKIGIDCDGGDNGALPIVKAVLDIKSQYDDIDFRLYGKEESLVKAFNEYKADINQFDTIYTKDYISMNDHPMLALRSKVNSSISLAGQDLNNGSIDALISSGSTGALIALSQIYIRAIDNIDRPALGAIIPTSKTPTLIIDCGANADCKPEYLYQFSLLGSFYMKEMFKIDNPKVGLLSVGTEENKGSMLTIEAYKMIEENKNINFIGNVEARDVPNYICDVLVTDGFSGNVLLKTYEGSAKFLLNEIKNVFKTNIFTKLAGLIIKNKLKNSMKRFDATNYGGAPILGAKKLILKCHGNSKNTEIYNAVLQAKDYIYSDINNKLKNYI